MYHPAGGASGRAAGPGGQFAAVGAHRRCQRATADWQKVRRTHKGSSKRNILTAARVIQVQT